MNHSDWKERGSRDTLYAVLVEIRNGASLYISGPVGLLAFCLNVLTIAVFALRPRLISKTARVYYLAISVSDMLTSALRDVGFFFLSLGLAFATNGVHQFNVENISAWSCRLWDTALFSLEMFSNLLYLPLECERIIALYYPFKASHLITQRRAVAASLGLFAVALLSCACLPAGASVLSEGPDGTRNCLVDIRNGQFVTVLAIVMLQLTFLVPAVLSTVLNVAIAYKLVTLAHVKHRLHKRGRRLDRKLMEMSATLLVVCALHDVILLPMGVLRSLPLFVGVSGSSATVLDGLATLFYPALSIKNALNFAIFSARVPGFKRRVASILLCSSHKLS